MAATNIYIVFTSSAKLQKQPVKLLHVLTSLRVYIILEFDRYCSKNFILFKEFCLDFPNLKENL